MRFSIFPQYENKLRGFVLFFRNRQQAEKHKQSIDYQ